MAQPLALNQKMNIILKLHSPRFDQPKDPLEIDSSDEAEHDKGVEADLKDERAFLSPHAQVAQLQL